MIFSALSQSRYAALHPLFTRAFDYTGNTTDYNSERDIQFFDDTPDSRSCGRVFIFFPEDAHAPLVSSGAIRKVIFKVAVS
jgi:beta-galactosidase beta subunit